jgi:hypothetical protein
MKICVTFICPHHCTEVATLRNYEVGVVLVPVIVGKGKVVPVLE